MRTCKKCGSDKPIDAFALTPSGNPRGTCRKCHNAQSKARYDGSPEVREAKARLQSDPEGARAKWANTTRGRASLRASDARRRAAKLRATPAWANKEAIDYVYYAAQVLREHFPNLPGPHVDHSIALQSRTASGLHVHENLVLMNPRDNMSKGNR